MPHLSTALTRIYRYKWEFLTVFFITVFLTYLVLYLADFYPEPKAEAEVSAVTVVTEPTTAAPLSEPEPIDPLPIKIIFDELDKEIVVHNPTSRTIADLDAALLEGAVRHPDSATFEDPGNIFILGHSSYLPTVFNKNFQAFNDIQKLAWGDTIRLRSSDTEYLYRVERAYKAKASEVTVPLGDDEPRLTLATCNSFGTKNDRFIVEAALVSSYRFDEIGR